MSDTNSPEDLNPSPATEGSAADGNFADGALSDYDALPDEGTLSNGGAAGAADPDDAIDITQSDGPNLEAGDDLDTGASGPSRP